MKDMGTLIYIGGFELPDKNAAAHRVLNNGKLFRSVGYNVIFIDVSKSVNDEAFMTKHNVEGFDTWSRKYPVTKVEWIQYLFSIKDIIPILKAYSKIESLICYNYPSFLLLLLQKFCKKRNIKMLADITEWYESDNLIKRIDTSCRMRYLHKQMDGLICISEYLGDYYRNEVKTVIIPPLVDVEAKKWRMGINKKTSNDIQFIYSGNPGKHKDKINIFLEVFAEITKMHNTIFNIIGLTEKDYLDLYPEHEALMDILRGKVHFFGKMKHEESLKYISQANYQVFLREDKRVNNAGFPTKFVESITCGTPVITTNTSDLGKYIYNSKNGCFVNIDDRNSIKFLLNKIISNNENINKIVVNDKLIFDYKQYSEKMKRFLFEILG